MDLLLHQNELHQEKGVLCQCPLFTSGNLLLLAIFLEESRMTRVCVLVTMTKSNLGVVYSCRRQEAMRVGIQWRWTVMVAQAGSWPTMFSFIHK